RARAPPEEPAWAWRSSRGSCVPTAGRWRQPARGARCSASRCRWRGDTAFIVSSWAPDRFPLEQQTLRLPAMRNPIMGHRFALALALWRTATPAALASPVLPDTEQGRRAAAYLEAFNSGQDDALRAFLEANVTKSSLAERPVEQRLTGLRRAREDHGH